MGMQFGEAAALELYCDGGVEIEEAGPCCRISFYAVRLGAEGAVRVPVVGLVVPMDSLRNVAKQLAAAVLLAPDEIGHARGSA